MPRYVYKLIMLGVEGVGKRTLIQRYTNPCAEDTFLHEKGIYYGARKWALPNGEPDDEVYLKILSPEPGNALSARWYEFWNGSNGILACYNALGGDSLNGLVDWLDLAKAHESLRKVPKLLVRTKCDLPAAVQEKTAEDTDDLPTRLGCFAHIACSARTGDNVQIVFHAMLDRIFEQKRAGELRRLHELVEREGKVTGW